ncbi:hypothetical protein KJ633_01305, partial [bacterium]|nr:hypothetical protein [bacterium]
MSERKKLFIIDGNNYMHRAFHALPPLLSPDGKPAGALYGFARMLLSILKKHKPERMAVVFDSPGKNFRHSEYSAYKANRPAPDETLVFQLQNMSGITKGLGIASISAPGFEADDLTASMAEKFKDTYDIYIVSADKDLCQLVDERVKIFNDAKKIIMGTEEIMEKYGVRAVQFCDWQALVGDKSDNIPGGAGIGPKGATALISEYGSIENIYEKIDSVKESLRQKLIASKDNIFLSKKLVTLLKNVPVPLDDEDMKPDINPVSVVTLAEKWGFTSLKKEYGGAPAYAGAESPKISHESPQCLYTDDVSFFKKCESLAIRFADGKKLKGIAFAGGGKVSFADTMQTELDFGAGESYKKTLAEIFANPEIKIVTDDSKRIFNYCFHENIPIKSAVTDLSLMGYVIDSRPRQDLVRLSSKYLARDISETDQKEDFGAEAALMFNLKTVMEAKTEAMGLTPIYRDIEKPLAEVLAHMEFYGVKLDSATLEIFSVFLEKEIAQVRGKIVELAGEDFNINSNVDVQRILFEKLKIVSKKKTKTGASVDAEVLRDNALENPICAQLIKYRTLAKMKSTYADALPALVGYDGRLHTTFNSTGTLTGRLSSSRPNLQNIPARGELAGEIRKAFVCD